MNTTISRFFNDRIPKDAEGHVFTGVRLLTDTYPLYRGLHTRLPFIGGSIQRSPSVEGLHTGPCCTGPQTPCVAQRARYSDHHTGDSIPPVQGPAPRWRSIHWPTPIPPVQCDLRTVMPRSVCLAGLSCMNMCLRSLVYSKFTWPFDSIYIFGYYLKYVIDLSNLGNYL